MRSMKTALLAFALAAGSATAQSDRNIRTPEYKALQKKLCRGWNTWSTNSVMAHVHLPDGFAITLGLKSLARQPYSNSFFQANETAHRPEKVRLGPHTDDGSFTELTLEWRGDPYRAGSENVIQVQSATEGDEQYILATVEKRDPLRPLHLIVETGFYWNRPGAVRREGKTIHAEGATRVFEVRTTAPDAGDPYATSNAPYLSAVLDGQLAVYTGAERKLDEIKAIIESHRARHMAWLASHGERSDAFTAMQTVLAWNLIYDPGSDRAITPVSRLWAANWGGTVLFDWDNYFASFMYSLFDKDLAYANAVENTKGITGRGFVPNFQSAYDIKSEDRSEPPVGGLMAMEIYRRHRERWFLEEIYPELLRWNRWWPEARANGDLLSFGSDPVPQIFDGITDSWQAAAFESGLDNSPMYDGVPFNKQTHLLELADVGLVSLYVADCAALAEMADILEKPAEAQELRARKAKYGRALETLWSEQSGIYLNRRTDTGEFSPKLSPTNFYPLIAGTPTQQQAERMAKEHYFNPAEFHGEWVAPAIARNVAGFGDQTYWRGRIWGPMNFLLYLGFRKYDLREARRDLVERSYRLFMKSWEGEGAIYENYNGITGRGNDVQNSDGFHHWGALLGVPSLLEQEGQGTPVGH
jgi:putative isomerase